MIKVSQSTIYDWLIKFKIPIRETPIGKSGKDNPMFGKTITEQHKRKIIEANLGDKSHLWRGGITTLYNLLRKCYVYDNWRLSVFKRDNFTCIHCGDNRGHNLNADHIKPFALILQENNVTTREEGYNCKELWDINNGRTLCKDCHKKTDTWGYGTVKLLKKTG